MQQDEAGEVPEGLIEEGRVDHALAVDGHAPGEGRRAAVGLAVDEIAPAADALADEQAERREIAQARERELFDAAVHEQADERADDAAVDSDAALQMAMISPGCCARSSPIRKRRSRYAQMMPRGTQMMRQSVRLSEVMPRSPSSGN